MVANVNVPNLPVKEIAGWRHTSVGGVPPRVVSDARLEPKVGHPGTFRVAMTWGDVVSLPERTDGGAIERNRISVTLLSGLSDVRAAPDWSAELAAEASIAEALDSLLGSG